MEAERPSFFGTAPRPRKGKLPNEPNVVEHKGNQWFTVGFQYGQAHKIRRIGPAGYKSSFAAGREAPQGQQDGKACSADLVLFQRPRPWAATEAPQYKGARRTSATPPRRQRSSIAGREVNRDSEIGVIHQWILNGEERLKIKNRLPGRGSHPRPAFLGDFVPRSRATPIFDECPRRVFLSAAFDPLGDKLSEGLAFSPLLFASLQAQQVKQDRLVNEDRPDALPVTESRMERHGPSIRVADQVKPAVDAR